MITSTTSTTLIDYAKIHGDELRRQAQLANGDPSISPKSHRTWVTMPLPAKSTLEMALNVWERLTHSKHGTFSMSNG